MFIFECGLLRGVIESNVLCFYQMLVADTHTGEIRRLFTGVTGAEITGITVTPDRSTMFINIQHPGDGDPTRSNFPEAFDGVTVPRDATIVLTKKDGGIIGS